MRRLVLWVNMVIKQGEMMLAYRFMAVDMRGLQSGTDVVETADVLKVFMMAPARIDMKRYVSCGEIERVLNQRWMPTWVSKDKEIRMYLKKVLAQPNVVGSMLIALMVCSGFVYAFAFDGFNIEIATGGEVEAWLAQANGGGSGDDDCSCGAEGCDTSNCRPEDCTVRKCPKGCLQPGEMCGCTAQCNTYDCEGRCPTSPASPY